MVDTRLAYNDREKLLFHACPYSSEEKILEQAFDHHRIGRNGKEQNWLVFSLLFLLGSFYGYGFYFAERREVTDRYALPNPSTGEKRIVMCGVLVGRTCRGNSMMTTCPVNYHLTRD